MFSESENPLSTFPLSRHQHDYLLRFARGETPKSIAAETGVTLRAITQSSTGIRRSLAARTTAHSVWKAWSVGIEITDTDNSTTNTGNHPLSESLSKEAVGVLRRLAGGYHTIELEPTLKLTHLQRLRIMSGLYENYSANTHPQLIAAAINSGFFDKQKPIQFSEQHRTKKRKRDKLTPYQLELLGHMASGLTYKQIAKAVSASREGRQSVTENGIHHTLASLRAKIARVLGQTIKGPYQTAVRATELGLLPLAPYLESRSIDPNVINDLPEEPKKDLLEAYDHAMTTGHWGDRQMGKQKSARLKALYKSLGAENSVQAALIIHAYNQSHEGSPTSALQLAIPNGPTVMIRRAEVKAVEQIDVNSIQSILTQLPKSGLVPAELEQNGSRVVAIIAGIIRGDSDYRPGIDDLTYSQLHEAYSSVANVLTKNPNIPNVGELLKLIQNRLKNKA